MGLAVVAGIIKNYNGAITVYSEKGHGSTFKVLLPVAKGDASEDKTILKALPRGDERILFVDDETALVKIGRDLLERLGYQVDTKTNPVEALDLFRSNPSRFDLIITDVTMPHLSGDQLMEEVLKINHRMPIILCSGFSNRIDGETAIKIGAHSYIEKPLDKDRLAFTVRKALDDRYP
jgi:DNA-binding NtrC family response regulator